VTIAANDDLALRERMVVGDDAQFRTRDLPDHRGQLLGGALLVE